MSAETSLFLSVCFYSFKLSPRPSAPLSPLPTLSALPSCCPNRMSCCENCSTFSRWLPSVDNLPVDALSPTAIGLVFSRFILRPHHLLLSSFNVCVVSSKFYPSVSMRSISSANARLFILVPQIVTPPCSLSLILTNIFSSRRMKVFDDTRYHCLVPLCVANHYPNSFPILTAAVAFSLIFLNSRVS